MSNDCPHDQVFMDFALGLLDEEDAQHFERHLTQCRDCALVFAELGRIDGIPTPAPPQAPKQRLGRYELIEVLGSGGQGVVWRAHDPTLNRQVALKLLLPDLDPSAPSASDEPQGQRRSQRLLREARALAALSHPHILTVYDVGEDEGRVWLATELLSGQTLNALEAPWSQKLELLLQIAQALHAAHLASIVHGDLKPANILLRSSKHAVLADFGLATPNLSQGQPLSDSPLSQTRSLGGTPLYMAPELLSGLKPTPASDQYALCVSAYELLFGMRPFVGESLAQLAHAATTQPLPKPRRTKIPHALFEVLEKGLSPSPHERFPDVRSLELALRRAATPPSRRPLILASVMLIGVLVAALMLGPTRQWLEGLATQAPSPAPSTAPITDEAAARRAAALNEACVALAHVQLSGALERAQAAVVAATPAPKPKLAQQTKAKVKAQDDDEGGFKPLIPSSWMISCHPNHTKIEPCLKSIKRLDRALKPYGGDIGYLQAVRADQSLTPAERNRLITDHRALLSAAFLLMLNAESCTHAHELHERYFFLQLNITPRQPPHDKINTSRALRDEQFKSVYAKCAHAVP